MECELKNKEVEINKVADAKGGNHIVSFYGCSGDYIDLFGKKVHKPCDMRHNEKCLLRNFK